MIRNRLLMCVLPFFLISACQSLSNRPEPPSGENNSTLTIPVGGGWLTLRAYSDTIIRVAYSANRDFISDKTLATEPAHAGAVNAKIERAADHVTLSTPRIIARVDLPAGNVSFFDHAGKPILAERDRTVANSSIRQTWHSDDDESLYGLGQLQLGIVDLKGFDIDLWQRNTNVVVPMLVSSKGYGIFWDNLSFTKFGDTRPFEPIPVENLHDLTGPTTQIVRTRTMGRAAETWEGKIAPTTSGNYQFQTYSNGQIKVWIDDKLVIDHWRQGWLAEYDQVKLHLDAGHEYPIKVESSGDQVGTMQLRWKTPDPATDTSLWSEVGDGVDYYFVYGPKIDNVVAGYRQLTGQATLMPKWAFGLFQSRQRYETAQSLMDVLLEFRQRKIPLDVMVQDWMYWPQDKWGSHQFDPQRFPDPDSWIKSIHDQHARLMISVWGKYYPGTDNFLAMQKLGAIYQPTLDANLRDWVGRGYPYTFYDAFNPAAGKEFWDQINKSLFSKGVDAWWMDASEPDVVQPSPPTLELTKKYIGTTALGPASNVINAYPLYNSKSVYEGQRATSPDQRVFILTRSGFAGIQRFATATWSGDITSTWTALAKQIPAGLGYSISGVPYWTMDVGGYTMQSRFSSRTPRPEDEEEWRELNVRWFQFGTFCPILRVHGELKNREMWNIAGDDSPTYNALLKFDQLRYRMLPYIYSVAGDVTQNGSTFMRPLVMDFPDDKSARQITDEYMFGPAFLVAPVTTYQAKERHVYLPEKSGWYDFWTGAAAASGTQIVTPTPYDEMPLFIRAGSIIPFGPELQYTDEKPADPITLFVYGGADGEFSLYEDQGTNYGYEKGQFTRIPIQWNDAVHTLTIGKRQGAFPGMLNQRTFNVVLISNSKPVGYTSNPRPDQTILYRGQPMSSHLQ